MSIIYQSLTKLRSTALGYQRQTSVGLQPRKLLVRRSRLAAPRLLVLTVLVFVAGVGGSYGIYQMQYDAMETAGENTIHRMIAPSVSSQQRYTTANGGDFVGPASTGPIARPPKKASPTSKAAVTETEPPRPSMDPDAVVAQTVSAGPPVAAANTAEAATVVGVARKTPHEAVDRHKTSRKKSRSAVADVERIRRANMRRSLDISRLIAEIKHSMHASNHDRTEQLLTELARRKGREDPYVMKLQSYWHTQQGNLDRASALLQKVLLRKPDDLEAGINMAILEIKAGRIRQADERLSRLREIYPEDTRIPELMEKIKS